RAYRAVLDRRIAGGPVVLPSSLPHAPSRAAVDEIAAWLRGRAHGGAPHFGSAAVTPSPPAAALAPRRSPAHSGAPRLAGGGRAALLVAVLRQARIRADVVLLATRFHHVDAEVPGLGGFDHVVVRARLATGDVWLDPSERLAPPGRLPALAQGRRALVIADDT